MPPGQLKTWWTTQLSWTGLSRHLKGGSVLCSAWSTDRILRPAQGGRTTASNAWPSEQWNGENVTRCDRNHRLQRRFKFFYSVTFSSSSSSTVLSDDCAQSVSGWSCPSLIWRRFHGGSAAPAGSGKPSRRAEITSQQPTVEHRAFTLAISLASLRGLWQWFCPGVTRGLPRALASRPLAGTGSTPIALLGRPQPHSQPAPEPTHPNDSGLDQPNPL